MKFRTDERTYDLSRTRRLLSATAAATVLGCTALVSGSAQADADPMSVPNGDHITLSGRILEVERDAIEVEYERGTITVEMDDADPQSETLGLREGYEVVIFGRVDKDLREPLSIEASTVYVEALDQHFYASDEDEEDFTEWAVDMPAAVGSVKLVGEVVATDAGTFDVDLGIKRVPVDLTRLDYDPLDTEGHVRIEPGDQVAVYGEVEPTLEEATAVYATKVTELRD